MENIDDTTTFMNVMPKEVMSRIYNLNDYNTDFTSNIRLHT